MYRFIQKHGKKILAVVSVLLMVAWAIPSSSKYGAMRKRSVGTIDGERVTDVELNQARFSWDILTRTPIKGTPPMPSGRPPVFADILTETAQRNIIAHPQMFLLLLKEAQKMGVSVGKDQLESVLKNQVDLDAMTDERAAATRQAIYDVLLVRNAFERAASVLKVSQPMVKHELAQDRQSITVNLVEFDTAKDAPNVPAPTADHLKTQFTKYATVIRGGVESKSNPFGFGYKYPDRVKLQYIAVPRADVRKAVESERTAYQWEVEARKLYQQHPETFTTRPSAPETPSPLSLGSGGIKSGPTTLPFEQAKADAINRILEPETNRRLAQIIDAINTIMAKDYVAYKDATGFGSPTTSPGATTRPSPPAPPSSLGVPYDSFDYLKKLAEAIQKQYKFLPTVVSVADRWLTVEELGKLTGVGESYGQNGPFAAYLMSHFIDFVPETRREESGILRRFEPGKATADEKSTIYIARVSEAEAAHPPTTLAEVEKQVRDDAVSARAYELAKADAQKLFDAAKTTALKDAAGSRTVVSAGPMLVNNPSALIPGYPLSGPAAERFIDESFKLVITAPTRPGAKPTKLIELPRDGKIIVAQLESVAPLFDTRSVATDEARLWLATSNHLQNVFAQRWYDYAAVKSRVNWVPDVASSKEEGEPTPAPGEPAAPADEPLL